MTFLSLGIDGLSFGLILFLISAGLTVTLGVMRVVNLAHCAFAMVGGYIGLYLVQSTGVGLAIASIVAVVATIAFGWILERTLYRWIYGANQLGQILMTIGLTFTIIATANFLFGSMSHTIPISSSASRKLAYRCAIDFGLSYVSRYVEREPSRSNVVCARPNKFRRAFAGVG